MSSLSLQDAIEAIQSEKTNDRPAGISAYRQIFAKDATLDKLDGEDKTWQTIFKAVFECVRKEVLVCNKKGDVNTLTGLPLNRLTSASRLLLWLTERSFPCFERKTTKFLVDHLSGYVIRHDGSLIGPIALDYLKSLRVVLSHPAHRLSLDADQWSQTTMLCFNILMTNHMKQPLPDVEEDFWTDQDPTEDVGPRQLKLEDIEAASCLDELLGSLYGDLNGQDKLGVRLLAQYTSFLLRYPSESTAHLPVICGLNKLLREIELNERVAIEGFSMRCWDTLAKLWMTKNKVLKEQLVITFRILLPHCTSRVASRPTVPRDFSKVSKMLSYLFRRLNGESDNRFSLGLLQTSSIAYGARASSNEPFQYPTFAAGNGFTAASAVLWAAMELAADLTFHLTTSDYRPSQKVISSDPLDTSSESHVESQQPSGSTIRKKATRHTKASSSTTQASVSQSASTSSPSKRLKLEYNTDPLQSILDALVQPLDSRSADKSKRLWSVQVLLFLISRHWPGIISTEQEQISACVQELLNDKDFEIQSWALLCLSAIAEAEKGTPQQRSWSQILTLCCRKVTVPSVTREAALAATVILRSCRFDGDKHLYELDALLSDLDLAFPPFPHDSVCDFFTTALQICSNDVVVSRKSHENKVAAWLQANWAPVHGVARGFLARSKVAEVNSSKLVNLLARICRLQTGSSGDTCGGSAVLPGSPVVEQLLYELETAKVRQYLLDAIVPEPHDATQSEANQVSKESSIDSLQTAAQAGAASSIAPSARPMLPLENRCYDFLVKAMTALTEEWTSSSSQSSSPAFRDVATIEQTRRTLDAIVVSMAFEGVLGISSVKTSGELTSATLGLFTEVMGCLVEAKRWTVADRSSLLNALRPIVQTSQPPSPGDNGVFEHLIGMTLPGPASCVRRDVLAKVRQSTSDVPSNTKLLSAIWHQASSDVIAEFTKQLTTLLSLLCGVEPAETAQHQTEEDGWGEIRTANVDSDYLMRSAEDYGADRFALEAAISICLTAIAELTRASSVVRGNLLDLPDELQEVLSEGSTLALDRIGHELSSWIKDRRVRIPADCASDVMARLGTEYLPEYPFNKSEHAQLLVLDFLEATLSMWISETDKNAELLTRAEEFCIYFAKTLSKKKPFTWRTRVRAAAFFKTLLRARVGSSGWDSEDDTLGPSALSSLLYGLASDKDMRVRFAVASMTATVFELCPGDQADQIHRDATEQWGSEANHLEGLLSRTLANANTAIVSSALRTEAFFFLLEPCLVNEVTNTHASELLRFVSRSLGFDSTRDLFLVLAGQYTYGMLASEADMKRIPFDVLGYPSLRSCLEHVFQPMGAMMAALSLDIPEYAPHFTNLARSLRKTEQQGIREVLPFIMAVQLQFSVGDVVKTGSNLAQLPAQVRESAKSRLVSGERPFAKEEAFDDVLRSKLDQLILALLVQFWEADCAAGAEWLASLESDDPVTVLEYRAMWPSIQASDSGFVTHEPVRPHARALQIYYAILNVTHDIGESTVAACVYHVAHKLLSLVWQERLINDQLRHLSALKLFLAMNAKTIAANEMLLRTLLHGASVLVAQPDMALPAAGIISWCLLAYSKLPRSTSFSSDLIALAQHIEAMASSADPELQTLGSSMFTWLEQTLVSLIKHKATSPSAFDALCAYPRDFSAEATQVPNPTVQSLSGVVARNSKVSLSTQVLQRFKIALEGCEDSATIDRFSRVTIWQLFSRMGRSTSRAQEAAAALVMADILYALQNKIKAAPSEHTADGEEHLKVLRELLASSDTPYGPCKAFIALQVMDLQRGEDLSLAESALMCMRAVLTQDQSFTISLVPKWPDGVSQELAVIATFPSAPIAAPSTKGTGPRLQLSIEGVTAHSPENFEQWICHLASVLCDRLASIEPESFYHQVRPLVSTVAPLARKALPALLQSLLGLGQDSGESDEFRSEISQYFDEVLRLPEASPMAWTTVINIILYLRTQPTLDAADSSLASDHWLECDLLLLARRSIDCRLYTTALLFIELLREHDPVLYVKEQPLISELLYQVYSHVEDPDSFYGVRNNDLMGSLVKRLHHEGEWQRAFELHAANMESNQIVGVSALTDSAATRLGLSSSLRGMGYNRLAGGLADLMPRAADEAADYEVAWRIDDWDLPTARDVEPGTSANVYAALRALHREQDSSVIAATLERSLARELRGLSGVGIEAVPQVRRVTRDLLSLREAKRWRAILDTSSSLDEALAKVTDWPDLSGGFAFDDLERLLFVRQSLLRAERSKVQIDQIGDMMETSTETSLAIESALLVRVSGAARGQERSQTAMNAITMADRINKQLTDASQSPRVASELASVLWSQGEHAIAIQALDRCLEKLPQQPSDGREKLQRATLMAQLGQWRATARSQQPRSIDEDFFRPAFALVRDQGKVSAAVCYQYATFADEQYRSLRNSNEIRQLEAFVGDRQEEIRANSSEMERVGGSKTAAGKSLQYYRIQAERILRQDEAALEQYYASRDVFLKQALKMYAASLAHADVYDDATVRLTSLWFENAEDNVLNDAISDALAAIPPHKFLALTHQLSSRLSKVSDVGPRTSMHGFQTNLMHLMRRMCHTHPFHTLYAIFALCKAETDETRGSDGGSSSRGSRSPSAVPTQRLRGAAAQEIWLKTKSTPANKTRVLHLEQVCDAYVEWAETILLQRMPECFYSNGTIKPGPYRFMDKHNLLIKKLINVPVPVATADIPPDLSGQYRNVPTIQRYSDVFNTAGGVHLPKIIECLASDGNRYKQLFKSNDDLRQDAVMQQVFRLLNNLLARDQRASKRDLKVRTYIVLPLGPQCGLLEFVGNTQPIGTILTAVHERYRAEGELTPHEARSELAALGGKTPQEKLAVYKNVCSRLPPAFHYYFFEQFKAPPTWFAVRLNYTRSVATTSIIGHVLGLGDRHVSNILLDNLTGEVVHIDFGIAFEQGKLLPIPELVPFRLSRDIIDGMGLSGIEGVFRRSSEETLRVLRSNGDVIKTVLEVFKYDPLWSWTTNPVKVIRAQRATPEDEAPSGPGDPSYGLRGGRGGTKSAGTNSNAPTQDQNNLRGRDTATLSADRAIGSVMAKLSADLSIQYTVNELIQMATDQGNLSAIFHGWQAAL